MGSLAWWVLVPATAAAAAGGSLALLERRYRVPRVPHRRTPADAGLPFEEVWFSTAGGATLYGWWIPGEPNAPTVILAHGWGRNATRTLGLARRFHAEGYAALAFDLRCHGRSEGEPPATMVKFSEDIRAAVDEAARRGASPRRIAAVGLSVGGSAAIHAAARDSRLGAVVTVGAFAHPGDAMAHEMRSRGLPRVTIPAVLRWVERRVGFRLDDVAPERQVQEATCPLLVVHGSDDHTVPVEHGRRLATAGGERVRLLELPGRGHSDCDRDPRFWPQVLAFLERSLRTG